MTDWIQLHNLSCNLFSVVNRFKLCIFDRLNTTHILNRSLQMSLWIALNYVSLTNWIQQRSIILISLIVVNRFKLCIFDKLNTTILKRWLYQVMLWIALNYVSLTNWIQHYSAFSANAFVVNRFKLCIFDKLNTTDSLMFGNVICCESL